MTNRRSDKRKIGQSIENESFLTCRLPYKTKTSKLHVENGELLTMKIRPNGVILKD